MQTWMLTQERLMHNNIICGRDRECWLANLYANVITSENLLFVTGPQTRSSTLDLLNPSKYIICRLSTVVNSNTTNG